MPPAPLQKKVAFILPSLAAGGAERVLLTLMNRLDRARFAPEFVTLSDDGPMGSWIDGDIPRHSLYDKRLRNGLPGLARTLRKIAPDTVVSTMAHMNFGVLLLRPFLKPRTRICVREANIPSSIIADSSRPFPGRAQIVRMAYKTLYPTADLVISPAQRIIDEFQSLLKIQTRNHALLYNPVDEARIRGSAGESSSASSPLTSSVLSDSVFSDEARAKTVVFVAAGRLHRQKGFDLLIAALARGFAMPEGLEWRLEILGEGGERAALENQIAAAGLEPRIKLRGLLTPPWPVIAMADAFLLPSRWEGLPNVVLESLAAGTRAIASAQAGGIAEIAARAAPGSVTLAETLDDFVTAMRAVRPDPARAFRPRAFRPSLLPDAFRLEVVGKAFGEMI